MVTKAERSISPPASSSQAAVRLVSDVLRGKRAEILERWEGVDHDRASPRIAERVRRLLDWITELSTKGEAVTTQVPAECIAPFVEDPEVGEIIGEYVVLRSTIAGVLGRAVGDSPEMLALEYVDRAIDNAVMCFADRRAQHLRESAEQEAARLRFFAEATIALASSLNYDETLQRVAQLAVPVLSDWCVVDLVDERGGELRRVSVAHRDPALNELARGWALGYPTDWVATRGVAEVIRTGEPELVRDIPDRLLVEAAHSGGELEALRALGLESYLIVPLVARGRSLGAITLVSAVSGRRFDASDVELAGELARRAALAVDNARSYLEAQQAIRIRDQVLATVSHDLRNPLSAIRLIASMLRGSHPEPAMRQELDLVIGAVDRMKRLIDDMIDTSFIQSGRLKIERRAIDPVSLVVEVVHTYQASAWNKRIALTHELAGGVRVSCDPVRITQVVDNLIGNALKFCRSGDWVHVRMSSDGERAQFDIADTGPGIAPDDLPRIFEPYWTSVKDTSQGSGLGLFICKGIVEAHGGRLWAESGPGEGTRICFTLPVADRD
jgi:signal transduction histidine kinase